jgi:hypothetical protein
MDQDPLLDHHPAVTVYLMRSEPSTASLFSLLVVLGGHTPSRSRPSGMVKKSERAPKMLLTKGGNMGIIYPELDTTGARSLRPIGPRPMAAAR